MVDGRYSFDTYHTQWGMVDGGIRQLWALPFAVQEIVLRQAMERFDHCSPISLAMLGFSDSRATDLVRKRNEWHGSRLGSQDILAAVMLGSLDLYPIEALKNLGGDCLDCGVWDNVMGSGYYYKQHRSDGQASINPGSVDGAKRMWGEAIRIPRVSEVKMGNPKLDTEEMRDGDGYIDIRPGVAYLFGIWPAIKMTDLNAGLQTRSNFGRYGLNAAVNSVTCHRGFNGVVTAEAIMIGSVMPEPLCTGWLPFQMFFDYVNPELKQPGEGSQSTFGESGSTSLEESARKFQSDPTRMLPKQVRRQR